LVDSSSWWFADWFWSIPIILFTVALHAIGLLLVEVVVLERLEHRLKKTRFRFRFPIVISAVVLLVTTLHGFEAAIWAGVYRLLDALPDDKTAMLYSLNAITSFGHANIYLKPHWQLMGAFEALNGVMLFGLTTAFLFTVINRVSLTRRAPRVAAKSLD
jgi:hypothetical protein